MKCVRCGSPVPAGHEIPDLCPDCAEAVNGEWMDEPEDHDPLPDHLQRCGAVIYLADAYGVSSDYALCLVAAYLHPQGMRRHADMHALRRRQKENGEDL